MIEGKNYTIDAKNIYAHEMIGLKIKVIESFAKERIGITGNIIDETMKTFKIKTKNEEKVLPKNECVFEFDINEKVIIDGKKIMKRPEDRIKDWRN
jgi:ribonuclease P protein subunit POP4